MTEVTPQEISKKGYDYEVVPSPVYVRVYEDGRVQRESHSIYFDRDEPLIQRMPFSISLPAWAWRGGDE